ncbi:YceI family protein [Sphingobacteriales bacterium UPWRP_1]|nr:polyisoprenoid-binding protein [Sphingobacteriales bacterium TSM_CSS]PSJ74754.1 YceI family protein [Sphingobacteriales bacterium UPWRP_1]
MKKQIVVLVLLAVVSASTVFAQGKYMTKNGHIEFFSATPMENIAANNDKVSSVLDSQTGKLDFALLIKAFEFEKALMQEHFNENYMESDKFPKSTFKGQVVNISDVNFSKNGTYNVTVKGDLTIHGVTKTVETPGTITVKDGTVSANAKFSVALADYNIEIPKLVRDNIAKTIAITVAMNYQPYEK